MNRIFLVLTLILAAPTLAQPTTSFSYQGLLADAGSPATGTFEFEFELWDASVGGTQVGSALSRDDVPVTEGHFTTRLDFGAAAFDGADRYLEVFVCQGTCAARGDFTSLGRTPIRSAPYATTAGQALSGDGHDHLGQAWTGTGAGDTPLQITGSFADGSVQGAALLVSNSDTGFSAGLRVEEAETGVEVGTARNNGLVVGSADNRGVQITSAGADGMRVSTAGDDGVEVGTAGRHGVYVQSATSDGVAVDFAGDDGISVQQAVDDGVLINSAGGRGVTVNSATSGFVIFDAAVDGLYVGDAGDDGVHVESADDVAFYTETARIGLEVESASDYGVHAAGNIAGAYVRNGTVNPTTFEPDLILGGTGSGGLSASGVLSTDPAYDGSLVLQSHQGVRIQLDIDADNSSILAPPSFSISRPSGVLFSTGGLTGSVINQDLDVDGDVVVTGTLSKGGGSFEIDHPLDPERRILRHSFVESPDMMNVYNGNAVLDARGEAVVRLPEWFEALNRDFRYQLTPLGAPGPTLYIADEIQGNRFRIAGGTPGGRVSWQVTGTRQDAWANENRIVVEEDKRPEETGRYLHPRAFGLPSERAINHDAEHEATKDSSPRGVRPERRAPR